MGDHVGTPGVVLFVFLNLTLYLSQSQWLLLEMSTVGDHIGIPGVVLFVFLNLTLLEPKPMVAA